jgi:hypothetical protein
MRRNEKLNVGFFLAVFALIFTVLAGVLFYRTYTVFGYVLNRWVFTLTLLSAWGLLMSLVNAVAVGERPYWFTFIHVFISFFLMMALILFIKPCLSPIGIYFTVNMGDVETNAVGVPLSLEAAGAYALAFFCNLLVAFFGTTKPRKIGGRV